MTTCIGFCFRFQDSVFLQKRALLPYQREPWQHEVPIDEEHKKTTVHKGCFASMQGMYCAPAI